MHTVFNIVFVVFFFSLCIFVHELGHLLVAIWRRLHVERFSVGFGKRIWGRTVNGIEFVISVLPFGGYVSLPQLDPADVPETSDGRKLPHAPPLDRALTAVAGPVGNVILGFLLGAVIWQIGIYRPAPVEYCDVVSVPEEAPEYAAGLRPGDRIVGVNGESIDGGWEDISNAIVLSTGPVTLGVRRGDESTIVRYLPAPNPEAEGLGYPFFRVRMPTVIKAVNAGSPAEEAGIRAGDEVLSVNGILVENMGTFIEEVTNSGGAPLSVTVDRSGRIEKIENLCARPTSVEGRKKYRIGVALTVPMVLAHPSPWEQFLEVFNRTHNTLRALFSSDSSVKVRHMSGPVGIMEIIWIRVKNNGFREGLSFIILVTFSLAFLNLLPIPILDGGHILYALIETVIRRRIPTRIVYGLQNAFAVLIISFMLYVTFFDIKRIPRILRVFRQDTEETSAEGASEKNPDFTPGKIAPQAE